MRVFFHSHIDAVDDFLLVLRLSYSNIDEQVLHTLVLRAHRERVREREERREIETKSVSKQHRS